MPNISNIGTIVSVSASLPATEDQAGYEALTFTEVTGVSSLGEFGPSYEILNHTDVKTGITKKAHGALNYGDPAMQYRVVDGDAGQGIVNTALTSRNTISLKIERPENDAGTQLTQYVQAIVSSAPDSEANAAATRLRSSNINLTSAIVEVVA